MSVSDVPLILWLAASASMIILARGVVKCLVLLVSQHPKLLLDSLLKCVSGIAPGRMLDESSDRSRSVEPPPD